eukprot:TRINITY_DN6031_c0_g1_i1.p1 TRINITY_DN6031_c0_g1~~TRINITY_DN6031_c0_g1_i1.p1  ORF type:complete len:228 (-),score=11.45 TRINITY_DN6031_c0_g1_i1:144-827(-)
MSEDPFHKIKNEIDTEMSSIEGSFLQLKGLQVNNPKRRKIGQGLRKGCDGVIYQIGEVEKALHRAEKDPARYGLSLAEISSRRKWATTTYNKAESYIQAMKEDQEQIIQLSNHSSKSNSKNTSPAQDLNDQQLEQQSLLRQQDEQLDELSESVNRLGQIGIRIHEELNNQNDMLDALDQDVQVTTNKIKSAQIKISEIIKKSGSCRQLICVIVLVVILIVLIVLAAM